MAIRAVNLGSLQKTEIREVVKNVVREVPSQLTTHKVASEQQVTIPRGNHLVAASFPGASRIALQSARLYVGGREQATGDLAAVVNGPSTVSASYSAVGGGGGVLYVVPIQ